MIDPEPIRLKRLGGPTSLPVRALRQRRLSILCGGAYHQWPRGLLSPGPLSSFHAFLSGSCFGLSEQVPWGIPSHSLHTPEALLGRTSKNKDEQHYESL